MSIYKKRTEILEKTREPRFIHKEEEGLTIMNAQYAFPWRKVTSVPICEVVVKKVEKAMRAFPNAHVEFNFNREHPAFIFCVTSIAKCSEGDEYNHKLGRKAAKARNISQACVIARTIISAAKQGLEEELNGADYVLHTWKSETFRSLKEL